MTGFLKDVAVALCALAYSAAILGLAALIVVATPNAPPPPATAARAAEVKPVPANAKPEHPAETHREPAGLALREL